MPPVVLLIMDGFGVAPAGRGNAISRALTPHLDRLVATYPAFTLAAAGEAVGLPYGNIGNSEVGHLNIGAGRIVAQHLPRITRALATGAYFANPAFLHAVNHVKSTGGAFHIVGMLSDAGVHSQLEHILALIELTAQNALTKVFIHAILDGRDTPRNAGVRYLERVLKTCAAVGVGQVATLCGRFYAMDRDHRWERTDRAYQAYVAGRGDHCSGSVVEYVRTRYARGVDDEEFIPTVMVDASDVAIGRIGDGDAIVFANFRADRMRQLLQSFMKLDVPLTRPHLLQNIVIVTMTDYEEGMPVAVAYPSDRVACPLACAIANAGLRQLHVAETEKYAHVTFFINGGREEPFAGEERILIPSPKVAHYDETPAMATTEITDAVLAGMQTHDVVIANIAAPDMVAHTGNLEATIKAIEVVDEAVGRIADAVIARGGVCVITADHGNAESLTTATTGTRSKEHSSNSVPCIIVAPNLTPGRATRLVELADHAASGLLPDVAPTLLHFLDIPKPAEMTGRSLV